MIDTFGPGYDIKRIGKEKQPIDTLIIEYPK